MDSDFTGFSDCTPPDKLCKCYKLNAYYTFEALSKNPVISADFVMVNLIKNTRTLLLYDMTALFSSSSLLHIRLITTNVRTRAHHHKISVFILSVTNVTALSLRES